MHQQRMLPRRMLEQSHPKMLKRKVTLPRRERKEKKAGRTQERRARKGRRLKERSLRMLTARRRRKNLPKMTSIC